MAMLKYTPLKGTKVGYIRRDDGTWAIVSTQKREIKKKSREDEENILWKSSIDAIKGHRINSHPILQKTTDKLLKGGKGMAKSVENYCKYKYGSDVNCKWGK